MRNKLLVKFAKFINLFSEYELTLEGEISLKTIFLAYVTPIWIFALAGHFLMGLLIVTGIYVALFLVSFFILVLTKWTIKTHARIKNWAREYSKPVTPTANDLHNCFKD